MSAVGSQSPVIELSDVSFRYPGTAGFELRIPQLALSEGESVAVVGPSGSGKTTLFGLLAGVLKPGSGRVVVHGTDLAALDEHRRRHFRITTIGQVFQAFELLHYLTVIENVMLSHFIHPGGGSSQKKRKAALELLEEVGLADRFNSRPGELSQGEQQRVAVCRALLNQPAVLLADEPTGNLDQANTRNVVKLLLEQAVRRRCTLLMATHDQSLLGSFSRVLDIGSVSGPTREVSST